MTTLNQIKNNPKCNVWGSLGSRNSCPCAVSVPYGTGKMHQA